MKNKSKCINSVNEIMENQKGNCAQAIFASFGPHLAKGKLDFKTCMKITSLFGGGINLTGNVCGAITGALMSLGLKFNGDDQELKKKTSQLLEEFKNINGSIICRELIGFDLNNEEELKQADQKKVFKKCKKFVFDTACLLENCIDEQSIEEGK